ncbi:MAG: hypothetical protein R2685_16825 [Candidatus Nitrosocosmicus sp.]
MKLNKQLYELKSHLNLKGMMIHKSDKSNDDSTRVSDHTLIDNGG